MKKLTIDSSVFISSLMSEDKFSKTSLAFFNALTNMDSELVLPLTVVLEIENILNKNKAENKYLQLNLYLNLSNTSLINIDQNFWQNSWSNYFKLFNLKTADLIVATTAYAYNSILISWDIKLLKEAEKNGSPAMTPSVFLKQQSR